MSNLIKHHFTSRFGEDGVIVNCDWKSLEICGWAYLTQDPVLLDLLATGKDMHREVGGMVLGCKPEEVTKEQRSALKPANFTLIYGGTDWNLVQKDGLDPEFAKKVYDGFWTLFKRAREWSDEQMLILDKNAEYTTKFSKDGRRELWSWYQGPTGRKFWFKAYEDKISAFCAQNRIYTARGFKYSEGMNYLTQSLCTADIHMFALGILFREAIKHRDKFLLINTVHDSVMLDCRLTYLDECVKLVKERMESVVGLMKEKFNLDLNVKFEIECEYGPSWGEMREYENI